jgi:hypothetical protein
MLLWLPYHPKEDDFSEAIVDITNANKLILEFLDQEIGLEQVLDEFSFYPIDKDLYLENLDNTLRRMGA